MLQNQINSTLYSSNNHSLASSVGKASSSSKLSEKSSNSKTLPDSVKEYAQALQRDLTFNSLPHIQNLTTIAKEEIQYYKQIAKVIEVRIKTAPNNIKLPCLYLLDSIIKNIGGVYLTEFSKNIVDIFYYAFKAQTDVSVQAKYLKLLKTWIPFFGANLVNEIEQKIRKIPAYGPYQSKAYKQLVESSPQIYVNPNKFKPSEETKELLLKLTKSLEDPEKVDILMQDETAGLLKQLTGKLGAMEQQNVQKASMISPYSSNNNSNRNVHAPVVTTTNTSSTTNTQPANIDWLVQILNKTNNPPITTATTNTLNISLPQPTNYIRPTSVSKLYDAIPKQCSVCGARFPTMKQLNQHLDEHQFNNQFLAKNEVLSRKWGVSEDDWILSDTKRTIDTAVECPGVILFGESVNNSVSNNNVEKQNNNYIPLTNQQEECAICGDAFDKIYDSDQDQWMIGDALFDSSINQFVHNHCSNSNKRKGFGDDEDLLEPSHKKLKD
ncbi:hypothetical protein ABK040_009792 [Willaertia magna]